MIVYLKILYEAIRQAWDSLTSSKLRTFLSLLGVTIGIFCIIAVKSAVDSLANNIKEGFEELGSNAVYLDKMPWNEDPGQNYWKYAKRPEPSFKDYEAIKERSSKTKEAGYVIFTGGRTIKYKSSAVENAFIMGSTYEYQTIQNLKFQSGRHFTTNEYNSAANKIILGNKIAEALFPSLNPINKEVKLFGQSYLVIGVLESEGDNMFNFINFDEVLWITFPNIKRFVNTNDMSNVGKMLLAQAREEYTVDELKSELTGIIRANRKIKPLGENNFVFNELSMLSQVLDSVFGVVNISGFIIGIFALIIGMFNVANIMFVSVKERTSIIGIKKALGAQSFVVLLEFLIESVVLCVLGGIIGLILVYVILTGISQVIPFKMTLTFSNLIIGVVVSVLVGIISGIIPALRASRMDPVEAIRS
jgi:putative ABC transport system permease protein